MKSLGETLISQLTERGYQSRIVKIEHVSNLKQEIDTRYQQGSFDEVFYRERLTSFQFQPPATLSKAQSLIVIAVPQPQLRVIFNFNGKSIPLIIPPTYSHYPNSDVQQLLQEFLLPEGYNFAPTALPIKLLAVHSGLAKYGKNNICYVPTMGSFQRLMAFYSDLPCEQDSWQEPQIMEMCHKCTACIRHCPTAAITSEHFLLRAERCLTFLNERTGEFPEWVDPSWHNCLVGCMHCQRVCPQNKSVLNWIEDGAEFSEEETMLILEGSKLPEEAVKKLENIDMIEYIEMLPRNLRALIHN